MGINYRCPTLYPLSVIHPLISPNNLNLHLHTHHTSGPELLNCLLEISIVQSDLDFLKYLFEDKKVDVNGERMNFCGLISCVNNSMDLYVRLDSSDLS